MAIRNQPSDQIDQEIDRRAMAGMLNLRNALELVNDGFDNRALVSQQLISETYQGSVAKNDRVWAY
jgi:hypothetical protein